MLQEDRDLFDTLRAKHWPTVCAQMLAEPPAGDLPRLFRSRWVEFGERIRVCTADDKLLTKALRAWLPIYDGHGLTLYRGESAARYEAGRLGFNWTTKRATAEIFGSGWNALHPGGGCLLCCDVPAGAIISAPDSHSRWLGEDEYVVEPAMLEGVVVIAEYPRSGQQ
ncbi:hypothetical protein VLK31_02745 [Variovorax sp. H27-G14]|uniref:hypothetical protein n=1 Tax=Variovorax sp. H27-G14 TaxID=3111914 RepID=UPI0038FBF7AA